MTAGILEREAEFADLVTSFDCLHDMGDPLGAARHVRDMLAPGGTWMVAEPSAGKRGTLGGLEGSARPGCARWRDISA